jgi:hypothetical protein
MISRICALDDPAGEIDTADMGIAAHHPAQPVQDHSILVVEAGPVDPDQDIALRQIAIIDIDDFGDDLAVFSLVGNQCPECHWVPPLRHLNAISSSRPVGFARPMITGGISRSVFRQSPRRRGTRLHMDAFRSRGWFSCAKPMIGNSAVATASPAASDREE